MPSLSVSFRVNSARRKNPGVSDILRSILKAMMSEKLRGTEKQEKAVKSSKAISALHSSGITVFSRLLGMTGGQDFQQSGKFHFSDKIAGFKPSARTTLCGTWPKLFARRTMLELLFPLTLRNLEVPRDA